MSASSWRMNKRAAVVLAAIGAAAVLVLVVAAREPSARTDVAPLDASAQADARPRTDEPPARAARATQRPAATTGDSKPTGAATALRESANAPAVDRTSGDRASDAPSNADVQKTAPVTVTGCLEADDETFRLKDTEGDVPTSRSWKSGFLKRRASSIELVDAAHRLELPRYVGQRVVATGLLVNREMQLRSLRRVSASCS